MTDPRTTMTVDVDVPEEIVSEARARLEESDRESASLEEFIADYVDIHFVVE